MMLQQISLWDRQGSVGGVYGRFPFCKRVGCLFFFVRPLFYFYFINHAINPKRLCSISYADNLQVQYAIFELENQCFFLLYTSLLLVGVVQELPAQIPDWGMIFIYSKEVCH